MIRRDIIMINKRYDQIDKTDIETLISDEEPESKNLDYKQELPRGSDSDKKEFLADVSSFVGLTHLQQTSYKS